jgi:hypothetical protein
VLEDRKLFFTEDAILRGQESLSVETSQGVPILLALVALDGTESSGLESEVLLLLPLEVPWLSKAGEESAFETSQGVPMLLALVALDETGFAGLEREVLLLLPLEVPWLSRAGEEPVAFTELADDVLLLLRSGVVGSTVIGSSSALVGLRRNSPPQLPDIGTLSGTGTRLATFSQLGLEALGLAML